jgi:hypothetical protein
MANDFKYDVFLSHSAKDKTVVRELAARLNKDGVRVWLYEEQFKLDGTTQIDPEQRFRLARRWRRWVALAPRPERFPAAD